MNHPLTDAAHLWPFLRLPVAVAYLWWAAVWSTVAYYYLAAARRSWRAANPGSHHLGVSLFARVMYSMTTRGLAYAARGQFTTPVPRNEHTYPSGMVLQFGIVCSALCSALFGVTLFNVDRSVYGLGLMVAMLFAVMLSTVGGMIHLYPPFYNRIGLWRAAMLFSWLGIGAAYAVAVFMAVTAPYPGG